MIATRAQLSPDCALLALLSSNFGPAHRGELEQRMFMGGFEHDNVDATLAAMHARGVVERRTSGAWAVKGRRR